MKYWLCSALTVLLVIHSLAQDVTDTVESTNNKLLAEGIRMYKSEMASWYGTDIFLEAYKTKERIGGYFSYTEGDLAKCIFYSKDPVPVVIGTMTFDSTYDTNTAKTDLTERKFTKDENDLYEIRTAAMKIIRGDSMFKTYKNINLNTVPLINGSDRKVYVLSGPSVSGVVVFGNDYLLTFDEHNQLLTKKTLHKNIIVVDYTSKDQKIVAAVHTHLPETGDFFTPTDICTLMLYEKFTPWEQHIVVSEHYMNFWNCKSNTVVTITREAMEKIRNDKGTKKKKQ